MTAAEKEKRGTRRFQRGASVAILADQWHLYLSWKDQVLLSKFIVERGATEPLCAQHSLDAGLRLKMVYGLTEEPQKQLKRHPVLDGLIENAKVIPRVRGAWNEF